MTVVRSELVKALTVRSGPALALVAAVVLLRRVGRHR